MALGVGDLQRHFGIRIFDTQSVGVAPDEKESAVSQMTRTFQSDYYQWMNQDVPYPVAANSSTRHFRSERSHGNERKQDRPPDMSFQKPSMQIRSQISFPKYRAVNSAVKSIRRAVYV